MYVIFESLNLWIFESLNLWIYDIIYESIHPSIHPSIHVYIYIHSVYIYIFYIYIYYIHIHIHVHFILHFYTWQYGMTSHHMSTSFNVNVPGVPSPSQTWDSGGGIPRVSAPAVAACPNFYHIFCHGIYILHIHICIIIYVIYTHCNGVTYIYICVYIYTRIYTYIYNGIVPTIW